MNSIKESLNYFKLKFKLTFGPRFVVTALVLGTIFVLSTLFFGTGVISGMADPGSPPLAPDGSGGS